MNVSQTSHTPLSWHHTFITIFDDNRPTALNEAEADEASSQKDEARPAWTITPYNSLWDSGTDESHEMATSALLSSVPKKKSVYKFSQKLSVEIPKGFLGSFISSSNQEQWTSAVCACRLVASIDECAWNIRWDNHLCSMRRRKAIITSIAPIFQSIVLL